MRSVRKKIRKNRVSQPQILHPRENPSSDSSYISEESDIDSPLSIPIQSINMQLNDQNPKIRELATSALMNISNEISLNQLNKIFDNECLALLISKLDDNNPQVVINSLNAIEKVINIDSEINDNKITNYIIESLDIFKIFSNLLNNFIDFFTENNSLLKSENDKEIMKKILSKTISFLANICEVLEIKYLKNFNSSLICTKIIKFIFFPDDRVLISVLNFLHVYSEFLKEETEKELQKEENINFLFQLIDSLKNPFNFDNNVLKAYCFGILFKVYESSHLQIPPFIKSELEKYIINLFAVRINDEFLNLSKILEKNIAENTEDKKNNEKNEQNMDFHKSAEVWNKINRSFLIILELLINLFESDENLNESHEKSFETESMNSDEPIEEQKNMTENKELTIILTNKSEICKDLLQNLNLIELLKNTLFWNDENQLKSIEIFENQGLNEILEGILDISFFSLSCLLNILNSNLYLQFFDSNNVNFIFKLINNFLLIDYSNENYKKLFSEILLLQLKLFKLLIEKNSFEFAMLDFMFFAEKILNTNIEEHILILFDIISIKYSINKTMDFQSNEILLDFLCKWLQNENILIAGQALNSLIDVYSDEKYDEILKNKGTLQILKLGLPVMENKLKEERKKLGKKKYNFLKELKLNLKRFIRYKNEHNVY